MSPKLPENTPDPAQIAQEALAMARALQGGGIFGPRVQAQLSALRLCLTAAKVALSAAKLAAKTGKATDA